MKNQNNASVSVTRPINQFNRIFLLGLSGLLALLTGCSTTQMEAFSAAARSTVASTDQRYGGGKSGYYEGSSLQAANQVMSTAADITDLILDTGAFERAFGQKLTARYGYQIAVDQVGPAALAHSTYASLTGDNRNFGKILQEKYSQEFAGRIGEELTQNNYVRDADRLSQEMSGLLREFKARMEREMR